jgi:hypothetical protein
VNVRAYPAYTNVTLALQGYTAADLRNGGGFNDVLELLRGGYTASVLRECGCSLLELREHLTLPQLRNAGFSPSQLLKYGAQLQELRECGVAAAEVSSCGCSCSELLAAGYDVRALKDCGFTVRQLHAAGCRCRSLHDALQFVAVTHI